MYVKDGMLLLVHLRGRWLRAKAEEVTEELVSIRLGPGEEWEAQPEEAVEVRFFDLEGVYDFKGRVIRVYPADGRLVLDKPQNIRRIQRRSDFRLEVSLEAMYGLWGREKPADQKKAIVRDMSAGGAFLSVEHSLAEGTRLWLHISFPGGHVLKCAGEVRRAIDEPPAVGVRFLDVSERDRDRIVQYLFQRQRELRKMGLL